jgi:hypothetical protein
VRDAWSRAQTFEAYLEGVTRNQDLWQALGPRVRLPPEIARRAAGLRGRWHLLVLSEDWCGDAVNTVPVVAALAEAVDSLDLRILGRDANLELMDAHLTGTARSIPVVMLLDGSFRERAWWGPRPAELQRWFLETGRSLPAEERYREIRRWYARDRGASALDEIVTLLERAEQAAG